MGQGEHKRGSCKCSDAVGSREAVEVRRAYGEQHQVD